MPRPGRKSIFGNVEDLFEGNYIDPSELARRASKEQDGAELGPPADLPVAAERGSSSPPASSSPRSLLRPSADASLPRPSPHLSPRAPTPRSPVHAPEVPVLEWRLERVRQALALAELSAKTREPRALESPWFQSPQAGLVRFRVFLVADGRAQKGKTQTDGRCAAGYGMVEVETMRDHETGCAFRVWLGSRDAGGDGIGKVWGPVGGLFATKEELLAEAEPGPGGGTLVVGLRLEHQLGTVTVLSKSVVWDVPIDSAGVRRARPGTTLRSRPISLAGRTTRCVLILKRKKHPGLCRLKLVPPPPVPLAVRIAGQTRRQAPFEVENLADLIDGDGFEVHLIPMHREPDGWLDFEQDCVQWTVEPEVVERGDWVRSKRFPFHGGSAQIILFPGANLGEEEWIDDDREELEPVSSLYVQIDGGRGGPWELWCGRYYSRGVVDPKECSTSLGMSIPRAREALVVQLYSDDKHHWTPAPED